MKKAAPLFVLSASVLWGSMGIVTRYVASLGFSTRQTAAVRICSAALVLVMYLLITDRQKFHIEKKDLKWFLGTGFGSLFVNNLAYAATVQMASLSVAVVLLYTAPFFVLILSVVLFGETLTLQKVAALLLAFTGCILVVGLSGANLGEKPALTFFLGLCTGLAYALYSIIGKFLVGRYESMTVTVYTFIFAASGTFLISDPGDMFCIITEHIKNMPTVIVGSVITLAMPYVLYSLGLRYMESSRASIIASFEVVAASLFGVFFFHERLGFLNLAGIVCVVAALILLQVNSEKNIENN